MIALLGSLLVTPRCCASSRRWLGVPPHPLEGALPPTPPYRAASGPGTPFGRARSGRGLGCSRSPASVPRHPVASGGASTTVTIPRARRPRTFFAPFIAIERGAGRTAGGRWSAVPVACAVGRRRPFPHARGTDARPFADRVLSCAYRRFSRLLRSALQPL